MNFTTPQRVLQTIRAGDEVEWERGQNRLKITNAANNKPPLSPEMAKKLKLGINVNWGELMVLLAHARLQYLSAFWSSQGFFQVTIPTAPSEHQSEWGAAITEFINNKMRTSLSYFELHRSRWSGVVCHGIGPQTWHTTDRWKPRYLAIEDLRIPTDTTLDFDENLGWFAARHLYTPFELVDYATNPRSPNTKFWERKKVFSILKTYKNTNFDYAPNAYDWETTPEKLAELVRQDGGFYSADAMPKIPLWHFYFKDWDADGNEAWFMRIVPEQGSVKGTPDVDKFLWTNDAPIARSWKEILHCQFGDLNFKSPFMYHSVRSLGFALLEPCFYTNLTRCKMLQHLFDQFNVWLRITDPVDKARAALQEFANFSVLKTGVSVVPSQERHQVDGQLVEMALSQLKQLQQEASASYTQESDTGTKKEQTAFETSVKLQQVNAMMGGLLMTAFVYAGTGEYPEICRRYCLQQSGDPDIQDFKQFCAKIRIPRKYIDHRLWRIDALSPIGSGNPTLAQANVKQLMEMRPAYDATAQQEILHEATLILTNDPRKAARWVPLGTGRGMTNSQRDAQSMFGTLMQGAQIQPREGLSASEQIETLLPLMGQVIQKIQQRDNVGTPDEIAGLSTVGNYIGTLIQQLSQDKEMAQAVKQYGDILGKLGNEVKALAQRGEEMRAQQQQQQGGDPKAAAAVQATMMKTAIQVKGKQAELRMKQEAAAREDQRRGRKFVQEQRREDAKAFHAIQREKTKDRIKAFQSSNNGES